MFQFPEFPLQHYVFMLQYYGSTIVRFRIRTSTDHGSFTAPRSLSQLVTSFIGVQCQGILYMLFVA
jgi:hypothetical protein